MDSPQSSQSPQSPQNQSKRTLSDMEEEEGGPALYPAQKYLCQRKEFSDMIEHYLKMAFLVGPHMRSTPEDFMMGFCKIDLEVRSIAWQYGKAQPMSHLSNEDKQAIIASLEGLCVQDDWDKIHSSLPPVARLEFGKVLLEAMLHQFIYKKFATSPFWHLPAKMDATDQHGDANFHKRLDYIYEGFKQILPVNAAWWKSTLVSICTVQDFLIDGPDHTPLSRATQEHRAALVKSYEEELRGCRLFQLLLDDPVSPELQASRDLRIRMLLELAAREFIAGQAGLFGNLVVERLPELATFDRHSDNMISHYYHAGFEPQHGARILLMVRPHYSYHDIILGLNWRPVPPIQLCWAEVLTEPTGPGARARWAAAVADDLDPTKYEGVDNEGVDNDGGEENGKGKDEGEGAKEGEGEGGKGGNTTLQTYKDGE
ncbi:hypothetical protein AbraIFM66951_005655 [Aspergillus brasiliensis]|uniref:Uncharacterized protein n=1 Tax=Aspergillus brasiliensis TaxID=319629 RepID=A0A9W5Z2X4_9EURO|nr:hypothetical protein AbraCBS73388_004857 [Aspergillus brasiliensis]GKZ51404.1 hypothetical protein AbraIFM66951_005655 [Aspergillus brasiliensis]